jgi:DNA-binding IclR family transcriptional regulator
MCPDTGQQGDGVETTGGTREGVLVLLKAGALLDCLAERGEVGASELAEAIGEPRSSVYRLLNSLMQIELVEPGAKRGSYCLGLKLLRLGTAVTARFDERTAALPVVERIHDETGETVFFCVRRGWEAVCIERLDGRRVQSLALQLGGSLPLHAGAASRALLAFEPPELWRQYVEQGPLEALTPETPTTSEALFELLEQTRADGYAVSDNDVTIGIAALGAPVFDHRGELIAALSMAGIRQSILEGEAGERMVELVTSGAREISAALGYRERSSADV